jgi:hypothetical protein
MKRGRGKKADTDEGGGAKGKERGFLLAKAAFWSRAFAAMPRRVAALLVSRS